MESESDTSPTRSTHENVGCVLLQDKYNERIFDHLGDKCNTLVTGVAQLMERKKEPDRWFILCTGAICYVKDHRNHKYSLRLIDYGFGNAAFEKWRIDLPDDLEFELTCKASLAAITFSTSDDKHYRLVFNSTSDADIFYNTAEQLQRQRRERARGRTMWFPFQGKRENKTPKEQQQEQEKKKKEKAKSPLPVLDVGMPRTFMFPGSDPDSPISGIFRPARPIATPFSQVPQMRLSPLPLGNSYEVPRNATNLSISNATVSTETEGRVNGNNHGLDRASVHCLSPSSSYHLPHLLPAEPNKIKPPPVPSRSHEVNQKISNAAAGFTYPGQPPKLPKRTASAASSRQQGWELFDALSDHTGCLQPSVLNTPTHSHGKAEGSLNSKLAELPASVATERLPSDSRHMNSFPKGSRVRIDYHSQQRFGTVLCTGAISDERSEDAIQSAVVEIEGSLPEGWTNASELLNDVDLLLYCGSLALVPLSSLSEDNKHVSNSSDYGDAAAMIKGAEHLDENVVESGMGTTLDEQMQWALDMGYTEDEFVEALYLEFRNDAEGPFSSVDEMIDALDYVQAAHTGAAPNNPNAAESGDYLKAGKQQPDGTECSARSGKMPSMGQSMEDLKTQLSDARSELTKISSCVICLDRKPEVVFAPCYHFVCCELCATRVGIYCPICRTTILFSKNIYQ